MAISVGCHQLRRAEVGLVPAYEHARGLPDYKLSWEVLAWRRPGSSMQMGFQISQWLTGCPNFPRAGCQRWAPVQESAGSLWRQNCWAHLPISLSHGALSCTLKPALFSMAVN